MLDKVVLSLSGTLANQKAPSAQIGFLLSKFPNMERVQDLPIHILLVKQNYRVPIPYVSVFVCLYVGSVCYFQQQETEYVLIYEKPIRYKFDIEKC